MCVCIGYELEVVVTGRKEEEVLLSITTKREVRFLSPLKEQFLRRTSYKMRKKEMQREENHREMSVGEGKRCVS